MEAYTDFAEVYDTFMDNVPYEKWADYIADRLARAGIRDGLVELVEKMAWDTPEAERLVRSYVEPALALGADHIVLGCTHYPFLTKTIEKIAGSGVKIVNPAPAIAKRAREVLAGIAPKNLYSEDSDLFCTTAEDTSVLASMVGMILSESPNNVFRKYRCTTIRL